MSAPFLSDIDWSCPWLAPLLPAAKLILRSANWRQALNDGAASLQNHRGLPIRFVPQAELPAKTSYEAFISDTGRVPTRDNLHDFFNALIWLTFPKVKAQLNALQAAEIAKTTIVASGVSPHRPGRGKVRDAATIFDENAAFVITCDTGLVEALRNHEWRHVFIVKREMFLHACEVRLFGHALLEKLASPYKAITAHAWVIIADRCFYAMTPEEKQSWLDIQIARQLTDGLFISSFTPLPVMGVPGWCGHQDVVFYDDITVFRPKRSTMR
jgi:hypothetical protein